MRWFKLFLGCATKLVCILLGAILWVPMKMCSWSIIKLDLCYEFAKDLVNEQWENE